MKKREREETSSDGEERNMPKLEESSSNGERTLIVVSHLNLFGIKINTNTSKNDDQAEFIWTKQLPKLGMRLAELESKKVMVGGENIFEGKPAPGLDSNFDFDNVMNREIYELKIDIARNEVREIAPSSIPSLHEGKGTPIVETFDDKMYVLLNSFYFKSNSSNHSLTPPNDDFDLLEEDPNRAFIEDSLNWDPKVFEVFDPWTCPAWKILSDLPSNSFLKRYNRLIVLGHSRIGDKLYLNLAPGGFQEQMIIFDFKTQDWSVDEYYFSGLCRLNIQAGFCVSVPGLESDGQRVILSFLSPFFRSDQFPQFFAAFFIEGKGFSYRQTVNEIFSFHLLTGLRSAYCRFLELGNGEFCGVLTGREPYRGTGSKCDTYLFVSIFSLEAITPTPSSNPSGEQEEFEWDFLRVQLKNQQSFITSNYNFAHVMDATFL